MRLTVRLGQNMIQKQHRHQAGRTCTGGNQVLESLRMPTLEYRNNPPNTFNYPRGPLSNEEGTIWQTMI